MIDLSTYKDLNTIEVNEFKPKPTTLTVGQKEAARQLWASDDGTTKIGVWECTPIVLRS